MHRICIVLIALVLTIVPSSAQQKGADQEQGVINAIGSLQKSRLELCDPIVTTNEKELCNSSYDVVLSEMEYRLKVVRLLKLRGPNNSADDAFMRNLASTYDKKTSDWVPLDTSYQGETATVLNKLHLLDDRFARRKQAAR